MTLERLHIDYGAYLLRCLQLYHVPEQECEDMRQDIYLRLAQSGRTIADTGVFGFCSKLARNSAVDWMRANDRLPPMEDMIIVDEAGFSGAHPEVCATVFSKWQRDTDDPNIERLAGAVELSMLYECDPEITAFEVIADLLFGLTMEQIGTKYGVSKATVSRWIRDFHNWVNEKLS